jgi:hypothetical protein
MVFKLFPAFAKKQIKNILLAVFFLWQEELEQFDTRFLLAYVFFKTKSEDGV